MSESTAHSMSGDRPHGSGRSRSLAPHLFEVEGKHHVFDPENGRFFRIDRVARDVLELVPKHPVQHITGILKGRYRETAIRKAREEVSELIESGYLHGDADGRGEKPGLVSVKPFLVSLTLNVASICNLSCIYCWNKGGRYGRKVREKRMDVGTALRAVDLLVENSPDNEDILVDFYGGEPLLNFEVLRATMDYCRKIEKESKKEFSYKVTTNGTLLTREMIDYFSGKNVSLGISIDGTKKVHNRNRPFPDGAGSWDRIIRNLTEATKDCDIHISSRATLVQPDLDMVKATKGLFRQGFYDTEVEFASESCETFRPDRFPTYSDGDVEKMKKEYIRFAKFYLKYSLYNDEAIDVGLSNNITRVLHECHRFSPCGAGKNFVTVSEEGDLYPCIGFIGMKDYYLGNVTDGFDLEALKIFWHKMRSVVHEAEECDDCWARYICAGNCPANNEQHNRNIFKPYRRGCDWLKFQLEVAMWLASEISIRKPGSLEGYEPI